MKNYRVIIQASAENRPRDHELAAAMFLAKHYFKSDIVFLRPEESKTPDLLVNGEKWELKSPKGGGKNTLENNLRKARKQSQLVIVDFSRLKIHQDRACSHIRNYIQRYPRQFRRVIVITKSKKVLEIL